MGAVGRPKASWSLARRSSPLLALLVALTVVVAGHRSTASAYVTVVEAPRGLELTERPSTSAGEVRATLPLTMAAGEARLLRAQSQVHAGHPDRNAIGQKITCERADGSIVDQSWSGTNLLARHGPSTVVNRLLFVAPGAGSYQCRLRVYVNSHHATAGRATLHSGVIGDVSGALTTRRIAVSVPSGGATMFEAGDPVVRTMVPVRGYRPPAGVTRLEARSDLYLTNCYGSGGAGCPRRAFPSRGSTSFAVQGLLVPENPACPTVTTPRTVRTFDHLTHHVAHTIDLAVSLPEGVACGSWSTATTVQWVDGLPFVVHHHPYSRASVIGS